MSVSNVNSIYGAQMGSNAGYDTPAIKIEEKESNIGAWLCGGLALVATLGVGIAAHKSGKAIASNDDNMFQTIWKGVKSWVGKNGDDVAKNIDDIPAECKTSFKTLFSEGKDATLTATQKQDIIDNADEISQIFSSKARKNATKIDTLSKIAELGDDTAKAQQLDDFFGIKGLEIDGGMLKTDKLSTEDQARLSRKLGNIDSSTTKVDGENGILANLSKRYTNKNNNYNKAANKFKNLTDLSTLQSSSPTPTPTSTPTSTSIENAEDADINKIIAKRLNRAGAAQTLAGSCKDTSSYINTQASLTKWLQNGDLTQDEYDNLMALAEQKFMSQNSGTAYLNYLKQTLKKTNGSEINFGALDEESINLLNNKFKGLKLDDTTKNLTLDNLITKRKERATSISEYLGLNGAQIPSEWTIEDNVLHFKGSTQPSPINIGGKEISEFDPYQNKSGGQVTGYTITLDKLRGILNPATRS